jgi:hypothetical protein
MHLISKLRRDAHLRHLYRRPRPSGPGRPKTDDGEVLCSALSRVERVDADDEDLARSQQVVNHPPLKRNLPLVVVHHLLTGRYALLLSTDVALSAQALSRYDHVRFPIEFLCRDAKQFTGLSECQARSANTGRFPCNATLSAVSFAKLEACQRADQPEAPFAMASWKRRSVNQHLVDRI